MPTTPLPHESIQIEFRRELEGKQTLFIKVPVEIEDIFKGRREEVSETYVDAHGKGFTFYGLTPRLSELVSKFNSPLYNRTGQIMLNQYGMFLYKDGCINFSIIRTKGISDGIEFSLDGLVLDREAKMWILDFTQFIKHLYIAYVQQRTIKASVTFIL